MSKFFLREVFWLILTSILSLFFSFIFLEFLQLASTDSSLKSIEKIFSVQLYVVGCIVSFFCIYIIRVIVIAVKKLTN